MKQDIPPRSHRRPVTSPSSAFEYSKAEVPYRSLQLTRHPVTMPDDASPFLKSVWKRLLLLAVMVGFGAICIHGEAARAVISWARSLSGYESTQQMAFESGR
jgi:hypothetical protein